MIASLRHYFRLLYQVEEGEGFTFALLGLNFFLIIGGNFVIGRSVSRSLFLSSLPPQYISFRYIIVTVGVVLTSLAYARTSANIRLQPLIIGSTAVMALGTLLFRLLLATPLANSLLLLGGLYVYLEILAVLSTIQFWTLASDLLDSRKAKRLFGPISAMGGLGGILAGAFVSLFAALVGTTNLLFVLVVCQIGCILCVWMLGRQNVAVLQQAPGASTKRKSAKPSMSQGFREMRAIPLLMSMAAIGIVTTMVSNIVDYQFDLTLQTSFLGNEEGLTSFLGSFYFWAGLIGFVIQLFLSSRLLSLFGFSLTLSILPLSFALGSVLILATSAGLWAVTLTRASEPIFRYNVHDTAFGLLDLPIARDVRARSKAVIGGILKPLTGGISGLLFLLVGSLRGISPVPWSFLVLLLIVVWLLLIRRVRGQYQETLLANIRRRRFDPAQDAIDISDDTTVRVLQETLRQPDEAQVMQALLLIKEAPEVDWSAALIPLLENPSLEVRIATLQRLGNPLYASYAGLIREQISAPEGAERAAAITAFCAIRGAAATPDVTPFLEDTDPAVRAAAVVGIIRYTGLDGIIQGSLALKTMLDHPDPRMRRAGADVLGKLEVKSFYQPLLQLMEDEEMEVQKHALLAAGQLRHPDLLPNVISHLGTPNTMAAATQCLLAFGEESCDSLLQVLNAADTGIEVRRQIPRVLGRITSPTSASILLRHLDEVDAYTRARVYKALVRLQARGVAVTADSEQLESRLNTEMRLAYESAVLQIDLQPNIEDSLLADALATRHRFAIDRIFYILGLLYRQSNMAEIRFSLASDDPRRRAYATELLDTTIARTIKNQLMPLLEGPNSRLLGVATHEMGLRRRSAEERAGQLSTSADYWIAACCLYAFGENSWLDLDAAIDAALRSESSLLRETALSAACRFMSPESCQDILRRHAAADDPFPTVRDYARRRLVACDPARLGGCLMPLSTFERIIFLRGVDLFRDIAGEDMVHIAQVCQEVNIPPGSNLIVEGDLGDCLYILVDGDVSVSINGIGEVNRQGPRDVVGEMAIISRKPRSATCTALTDITALRIDHEDFWDLLAEKPALSMGVIRVLSTRLSEYRDAMPRQPGED